MPAKLRAVAAADFKTIQAIYAHHVLHGLASFEEDPPDVAEIARRHASVAAAGLPWIVAEADGRVLGFAYAGPYRARPAYRYAVENSIYIDASLRRAGLGRLLLARLIEQCAEAGRRQMIAIIGDSENHASIGLHASLGFTMVGNLRSVGFKFGRWVDSVIMQRALGPGDASLP
ncbi:MAG TPA: GNAT family N-acetyltransferase [Candidatus Cybelea sp.]|nr:GNAT family N-acetyltransferase [Candidatus Cybelea sp.]